MVFRRKRQLVGRRVLVTGASSGIGKALAIALAQQQAQLCLTGRRTTQLVEVAKAASAYSPTVKILAGDLTLPNFRNELIDFVMQHWGGLDMLINNAGMGGIGTFESADQARLRQIMEINFFAPAELIRLALPNLLKSPDGVIVNICSVLGHCAVPKKSEYCASKFAMHGLSDALRSELDPLGIEVILISPSTTQTEFFDHALRSDGQPHENTMAMSAEFVANKIVSAIRRHQREVILSAGGKLLVWADRLVPDLVAWILKKWG